MRQFVVVVAATASTLGIGKNGTLPWRLKGDMAYFKRVTSETRDASSRNAVIMGRKTWESIPPKFRPLPGRYNVVLTRSPEVLKPRLPEGVGCASSLEEALRQLDPKTELGRGVEEVFVIGGGKVYDDAVRYGCCKRVLLTEVTCDEDALECDTFFPRLDPAEYARSSASEEHVEGDFRYTFATYDRCAAPQEAPPGPPPALPSGWRCVPHASGDCYYVKDSTGERSWTRPGPEAEREDPSHEEWQYLDAIRDIIENGVRRGDRTGTGTLSKFGVKFSFDLRGGRFPLLTTKRVFWRGVAEELLWFVAGCTDARVLQEKKIHIWDGNSSREFLDRVGLSHREEGDLGPVYGFQWRHFGAKYTDFRADYSGEGVDQLAQLIRDLKERPESRRHIITAWNPVDIPSMALPPCHMMCQFYVDTSRNELSCMLYQRSADMGLGVPFNIASYALLTRMVAQVAGMQPGDFVHVIGDAHVYLNHVDALKEQLKRQPKPFPTLSVNPDKQDIDAFDFADFTVNDYAHHGTIKMDMSA